MKHITKPTSTADHIIEFFSQHLRNGVDVYNEASLQFELAYFLRTKLAERTKIQFEKPVKQLGSDVPQMIKKEIDLTIVGDMTEFIELKHPRNGQFPEQMFSFCKDIRFLEQLVEYGPYRGYFAVLVNHKGFYSGSTPKQIYKYFRAEDPIHGRIKKPTGKTKRTFVVEGSYTVTWRDLDNGLKWALIEVS